MLMVNRRWLVIVASALVLVLVGVGCGGSDSDSSDSSSADVPAAEVEPEADETTDAAADLDPDEVDPCLLEPAEILALIDANQDAMGGRFGTTLGAGVRDPEYPNQCSYMWSSDDPGMPGSAFSLVVYAPRDGCLVEHRGVCLLVSTTYAETPIVVPDELVETVKGRIDAQ